MLPFTFYTIAFKRHTILALVIAGTIMSGGNNQPVKQQNTHPAPFEYTDNLQPRWSSPENINGLKSTGGKENNGAKGHPYDFIAAGNFMYLEPETSKKDRQHVCYRRHKHVYC